jgi:adenosylhomocysteine nucleosidase
MIAVTFALPAESSDFVQRLKQSAQETNDGFETIRGELHGKPVTVFHTGVGEKCCKQRVEMFLRRQRCRYLLSAGFAGALNDQLRIGDLVLAENFIVPELQEIIDLTTGEFILGKLTTSPTIVDGKIERSRLATATGAAAVDMETEFIAAACRAREILMLSLRAITDTPSQPLPAPADVLFSLKKQKPALARLALHVMTNPRTFPRMLAFRQRIALARRKLAIALDTVIGRM